jgi:hypothetical protein
MLFCDKVHSAGIALAGQGKKYGIFTDQESNELCC